MKKLMLILTLMIVSLSMGCNTVQGVGKDVQEGGQAIQKAAN